MAPLRSLDTLMDAMVEEFLLRLPPDDPKSLLRSSLVCKQWRRIVSDRAFRRRFRELHRTPPMLGMFSSFKVIGNSGFIPTCCFRPCPFIDGRVIDVRHGRVLLCTGEFVYGHDTIDTKFEIWNPIIGNRKKLPVLPRSPKPIDSWNAAVLRRGGQSLVVFVSTDRHEMSCDVYSSVTAAWSERVSVPLPFGLMEPSVIAFRGAIALSALVGDVLYFMIRSQYGIMKYDLGTREISFIDRPPILSRTILMTTEQEGLGLAAIWNSTLFLFSRKAINDRREAWKMLGEGEEWKMLGDGWKMSRSFQLKTLLSDGVDLSSLQVVGSAEGVDTMFLGTECGLFTFDLKSIRVTKVSDKFWLAKEIPYSLPYVGFYTPVGAASAVEGPTADAPSSSA